MGGVPPVKLKPVSDYLFGPDIYDGVEKVIDRYGLPAERLAEFFDLIEAWAEGQIELSHLPDILGEAFGLDAEKAKAVALEVVGHCVLPLERYYKGIPEQIEAWDGKVADYPPFRVPKEMMTADQFAGRMTEQFNLTLQPAYIKRLGFLVREYTEGKKNRDTVMTFFQRPVAIGGLGLSAEVSEKVLGAVDAEKDVLEFVDEMPKPEPKVEAPKVETPNVEPAPAPVAPPVPAPATVPVMPTVPEIAPSHKLATSTPVAAKPPEVKPVIAPPKPVAPPVDHDAEEIAKHEKMIAKKGMASAGDAALEAAVQMAVESATATLTKKKIAKKDFADVARLTIKGVRDPYQTRAVLERDYQAAGEDLVQLLEAVMLGLEEYHKKPSGAVAMVQEELKKDTAAAERQALDTRFAAVAGKLPTEKVEPVLPSARVSAARTKEEEIAMQTANVNKEKLEQAAAASKPEPAKAMLTVGSVPPPAPGEQKVLTDVQFRPKLVGPVEELGTMAPADFRRLSSNPAEAAKKIEVILTNLEATSYEDRIRGVQAWRRSPINALYTQMAAESLQEGIALAEVASRRRNKGQESLSPAEMKAIASINARIQF